MDALYVVVASLMRLMERTLARFRADLAKLANLGPDREEAGPRGLRPPGQWCESLRSFPKEFNHPPAQFGVRAVPLYQGRLGAGATIGCLGGRIGR